VNSAMVLREAFESQGYKMKCDTLTNQHFLIILLTTVNMLIYLKYGIKTMYIHFVSVG